MRKHEPTSLPRTRAVRVAGTLDTISATRPDITLALADGRLVRARVQDHDPETLRCLFGERVVVSGIAHYLPSGRLKLIDVESIEPARVADDVFATVPASLARPVYQSRAQDGVSGASVVFGAWPGDETEDELLRALDEIR